MRTRNESETTIGVSTTRNINQPSTMSDRSRVLVKLKYDTNVTSNQNISRNLNSYIIESATNNSTL
jgi:hypothetical protein